MRRNEEYLANRWARKEPAVVQGEWRLNGRAIVTRRVGTSEGSVFELRSGEETYRGADAEQRLEHLLVRGELPLAEVLATSGLLEQDELRHLLVRKPSEQYRQLLRLLGLEVLERFERHTTQQLQTRRADYRRLQEEIALQRRRVQDSAEELETIRLQVGEAAVLDLDLGAISSAVADSPLLDLEAPPQTPEDCAAVGGTARSLATQLRRAATLLQALPTDVPPDQSQELEAIQVDRREIQGRLIEAEKTLADTEHLLAAHISGQDALSRLAAVALPLLDTDLDESRCPVCQSIISPRAVAAALSERARDAADRVAVEADRNSAHEEYERLTELLAARARVENELGQAAADRRRLAADLRAILGTLKNMSDAHAEPGYRLRFNVLPLISAVAEQTDDDDDRLLSLWAEGRFRALMHEIEELAGRLERLANVAESASAAGTAARVAAERAAALPRHEIRHREEVARLARLEDEEAGASRAASEAAALAEQSRLAASDLFRERFDALEPLINDIYSRLSPHVAFTRLGFLVETYRARGTATASVIDEQEPVHDNPMLVLSSAQTNAVVLALFLALGWAAHESGLPFILLDDPFQAMDDVNALGMADLARWLRRQRQLVLATHEQRFADLLERKLTGRTEGEDLLIHRFVGWSRSGPEIETNRVAAEPSDTALRILAS